jgi:hypothetical protein
MSWREVQQLLNAVEEKWFRDEINKDTYERWYSTYRPYIDHYSSNRKT